MSSIFEWIRRRADELLCASADVPGFDIKVVSVTNLDATLALLTSVSGATQRQPSADAVSIPQSPPATAS
jgi:hypothetical protein